MNNVFIDHPHSNLGHLHRAYWLARAMRDAGLWNGQSRLVFKSPSVVADDVRESQLTGQLRVTEGNYTIEGEV